MLRSAGMDKGIQTSMQSDVNAVQVPTIEPSQRNHHSIVTPTLSQQGLLGSNTIDGLTSGILDIPRTTPPGCEQFF